MERVLLAENQVKERSRCKVRKEEEKVSVSNQGAFNRVIDVVAAEERKGGGLESGEGHEDVALMAIKAGASGSEAGAA